MARKAEIARIEQACATSDELRCEVISLYGGGIYDLYKYRRYIDGNIHSLGGDFGFDESLNRAVAVNSGAILEALDRIYSEKRVLSELTVK
jgi:hypothetical protein